MTSSVSSGEWGRLVLMSPPLYVMRCSQPSFPPCICHLTVHALKLKQVGSPLSSVSVLSSAHCLRPSQLSGPKAVLCDPLAELYECYCQYKVQPKSGPSIKDQIVNILHFAGCIISVTATWSRHCHKNIHRQSVANLKIKSFQSKR